MYRNDLDPQRQPGGVCQTAGTKDGDGDGGVGDGPNVPSDGPSVPGDGRRHGGCLRQERRDLLFFQSQDVLRRVQGGDRGERPGRPLHQLLHALPHQGRRQDPQQERLVGQLQSKCK